jgi:hypothetical protein
MVLPSTVVAEANPGGALLFPPAASTPLGVAPAEASIFNPDVLVAFLANWTNLCLGDSPFWIFIFQSKLYYKLEGIYIYILNK